MYLVGIWLVFLWVFGGYEVGIIGRYLIFIWVVFGWYLMGIWCTYDGPRSLASSLRYAMLNFFYIFSIKSYICLHLL